MNKKINEKYKDIINMPRPEFKLDPDDDSSEYDLLFDSLSSSEEDDNDEFYYYISDDTDYNDL